ncbi:MAG: hypothetical protein FJ098_11810 [Deltaproteobacteria bacterium]|nr:hypothetical protein [Deltaproteobacteria bacterium]
MEWLTEEILETGGEPPPPEEPPENDPEVIVRGVHPVPPEPREDLRSRLLEVRRSMDRRLLWARSASQESEARAPRIKALVEQASTWALDLGLPAEPQPDALRDLVEEAARGAGLRATGFSTALEPPDLARLPETYTGDRPFELEAGDLLGTVHMTFLLDTVDLKRIGPMVQALHAAPRFVLVNRLRVLGESMEVLADAWYQPARTGPLRREATADLAAILQAAGIEGELTDLRQQDPEHSLLATEVSIGQYNGLLATANGAEEKAAELRRLETVTAWFDMRLRVRAGRPLESLLK